MTESKTPSQHPFFELLPKLSNYLIGVTILCYGAGFAITNLYLGSMGIVSFDILRTRYILAGLMFLFYVGAIIYLTSSLIQTLRKNLQKSQFTVIKEVAWSSMMNIAVLYFAVPAIGILAGTTGSQKYSPPQLTQPEIPWLDWLSQAPLTALRNTGTLSAIAIFSVLLVVAVFILINPKDKDGNRRTRRQILKEAYQKMKETKGKIFIPLLGAFALFYLLNLSSSLLSFYVSGKLSTASKTTFTFPNGWTQLFNSIVIIYLFVAVYLTFIALYPPSTSDNESSTMSNSSASIYLIALSIIIIVPVYILRVYPALPQQIGGGQLIKVHIAISDNSIEPKFSNPEINTYLIDRTSNTSFFMLQKNDETEYKIVEIQNGIIQSIVYAQSP